MPIMKLFSKRDSRPPDVFQCDDLPRPLSSGHSVIADCLGYQTTGSPGQGRRIGASTRRPVMSMDGLLLGEAPISGTQVTKMQSLALSLRPRTRPRCWT